MRPEVKSSGFFVKPNILLLIKKKLNVKAININGVIGNEISMKKWKQILLSILIPEAARMISGLVAFQILGGKFTGYKKPSFTPPDYVFGPAWTVLYALMGIASYRVWKIRQHDQKRAKKALNFYSAQLFFNFLWSIIFFGLRYRGLAFLEILVLLILIVQTTVEFFKLDKIAGYLMIPYFLWVSFATILNYSIWQLNR